MGLTSHAPKVPLAHTGASPKTGTHTHTHSSNRSLSCPPPPHVPMSGLPVYKSNLSTLGILLFFFSLTHTHSLAITLTFSQFHSFT